MTKRKRDSLTEKLKAAPEECDKLKEEKATLESEGGHWKWVPEALAGKEFDNENEAYAHLRDEVERQRVRIEQLETGNNQAHLAADTIGAVIEERDRALKEVWKLTEHLRKMGF